MTDKVREALEAVGREIQAQEDGDAPMGSTDLRNAFDELKDALTAAPPPGAGPMSGTLQ